MTVQLVDLKDIQPPESMQRAIREAEIARNSTIIFPAPFLDSLRSVAQFVDGERDPRSAASGVTRT